jgi:hypothetical protein
MAYVTISRKTDHLYHTGEPLPKLFDVVAKDITEILKSATIQINSP